VLKEPIDQQPAPRQRTSAIAVFAPQIATWLDQQWSVQRMLEEASQHPSIPTAEALPLGQRFLSCAAAG
jgi:hypothetical protein